MTRAEDVYEQLAMTRAEEIEEQFKNINTRMLIAKNNYALHILKDDPDGCVRAAVANRGYALEQLKNDRYWYVRVVVAHQGYALDELENDQHEEVRRAVVEYRRGEEEAIKILARHKVYLDNAEVQNAVKN